jgi:hypothetical protein
VLGLMHTTLERYTVSVWVMSIVGTAVVRKICILAGTAQSQLIALDVVEERMGYTAKIVVARKVAVIERRSCAIRGLMRR